jgi:hypothetical protein
MEIKAIEKYVFKLIIPWKLLGLLLLLCGIGYVIFQYILFTKLPLVYTYKNDVAIYSRPDTSSERTSTQMDIYGQKFTAESKRPKKSNFKMLMLDSTSSFTSVKKNSFIKWLFNKKPDGYVKNDEEP